MSGPFLPLPGAEALAEGGVLHFAFERDGQDERGFVLRHEGRLHAYRNLCRHDEVPLDMDDGEVFADDRPLLRCRLHGALYRPSDGICVEGPCPGARLERFPVERVGGTPGVRLAPGDRPRPAEASGHPPGAPVY